MRILKALVNPPKPQLTEYFEALKANGVTTVTYLFSGGGDNGQIDQTQYTFKENCEISGVELEQRLAPYVQLVVVTKRPYRTPSKAREVMQLYPLTERLEAWASDVANSFPDWWSNDGGYGSIDITVDTAEWEATVYYHGYDSTDVQLSETNVDRLRTRAGEVVWEEWTRAAQKQAEKDAASYQTVNYWHRVDWCLLFPDAEEEDDKDRVLVEFQDLMIYLLEQQGADYEREDNEEVTLFAQWHEDTKAVSWWLTYSAMTVTETSTHGGDVPGVEMDEDECEN